jgi:hypothetical protein
MTANLVQTPIRGNLEEVWDLFPPPVEFNQTNPVLMIVDYTTWKILVKKAQADLGDYLR